MTVSSENIIHSGIASRTAHRVALLRAAHQLLDEPIVFDDPVALPILGEAQSQAVREDPFQFNDPMSRGLRAAVVLRSRAAEDALAEAVQAGVTQYVVLGAGLDTFAYRNPHEAQGLKVFEVDHPSTQSWKRALLDQAGVAIPPLLEFVAVDFEAAALKDRLAAAGFRFDRPACFSWLGVTQYLSSEAVFETLRFIASLPPQTEIVFDYRVLPALLHPIDRVIADFVAELYTGLGEPWKSAFDPAVLQSEILKMGFGSVEDLPAQELNRRYLSRRKDGLYVGNGLRLMRARR